MPHANLAYSSPSDDAAGLAPSLSIFADRAHLREQLRDDVAAAGFRVIEAAGLGALLEGEVRLLGEVVLIDCPVVDGAALAALARIDVRAAHSGAHLLVSTSVAALDDVFACMDQSQPQILVDPRRAERIVALGRVLGLRRGSRLRELSEEDRLMLLGLTEQVGQIAERLDRLGTPPSLPVVQDEEGLAFRFEAPRRSFSGEGDDGSARPAGSSRPALPDPRLVRAIVRRRQQRARFFDGDLFADPAWDILLDLTAARAEQKRVSVTSLCIASGVPPTTALRWIGQMIESGLLERAEDDTDRRRAFITLSDGAADAMARYFAEIGNGATRLV